MAKKEKTSDALSILHGRYIKDRPERKESVQAERVNAEVARMIYDLRKQAGLSQQELADLIETTQSVISRLEDADYEGHSLSMLSRIAGALGHRVTVAMTASDPKIDVVRYTFPVFVSMLRRSHGLSVEALARTLDIDKEEVVAMERNIAYRPTPLTLHKLSKFYGLPERQLMVLVGAVQDVPEKVAQRASRFAAQSESFAKLSDDERKALDDFVEFLKTEA